MIDTKHWRITDETKKIGLHTFHRIELSIDCRWGEKGLKGGWIENENSIKYKNEDSGFIYDGYIYAATSVYGGIIRGGIIKGGVIYGGVIWNGEIWNGIIRGGVIKGGIIRGGIINKTLLQIQGSRDFVNICDVDKIAIGCEIKTFDKWLLEYKEIGRKHGYTDKEIEEYLGHIKYIIQWSKDNPDAIKNERN